MATQWKPALDTLKAACISTFTQVSAKLNSIIQRLNAHTTAKGNVHDLTAEDLGLELVPNFDLATKEEAVAATNNTTLMSPARTNEWAEENVYGPIAEAFGDAADKL